MYVTDKYSVDMFMAIFINISCNIFISIVQIHDVPVIPDILYYINVYAFTCYATVDIDGAPNVINNGPKIPYPMQYLAICDQCVILNQSNIGVIYIFFYSVFSFSI